MVSGTSKHNMTDPLNSAIGCITDWGHGSYALTGDIGEIRMSKGVARWTPSFAPPAAPDN